MFTPLADKVVVKRISKEDATAGGILLPEQAKQKPQRGIVQAVGPGRYSEELGDRIRPDVAVGDEVVFANYAGTEIKVGNDTILIVLEKEILAVVESVNTESAN